MNGITIYPKKDNSIVFKDIKFETSLQIGDQHCQLYTLGDAEDLPALCGSRINFDRYSTDKTKFSIGIASTTKGNCSANKRHENKQVVLTSKKFIIMRKLLIVLAFVGIASTAPTYQVQAQIPIAELIKAAVKKVIKAVDWSQHGSTSYAL